MFPSEYSGGYYKERQITHHFQYNCPIGPGEYSEKLLKILDQSSTYEDTVVIHLNCPGGSLSVAAQIVAAMQRTQAKVVCIAEGNVYSGAALLFFAAHEMYVQEFADFMVHDASGGIQGKLSETGVESDHMRGFLKKFYSDTLQPFFLPEEVEEVLKGSDKWMLAEEVSGRLDRVSLMSDNNNREGNMKIIVDKASPMTDKIMGFVKANDLHKLLDIVDIKKNKRIADEFGITRTPTLVTDFEAQYYGYDRIKSYLKGFTGRELQDV